jgi:hypothetical protein
MSVPVVSESTLIDVFDMLIKRLDTVQDTIAKMNAYLMNEARYKTNNIISGSIFDYPFEIHNYKFDKKRHAYIHITLNGNGDRTTLYDILWSIWDPSYTTGQLTRKQEKIKNNLREFMIALFGENTFESIVTNAQRFLQNDKEEQYITCKYYNIDTLYDHLPEYILNEFMTKHEKLPGFKSFNHVDDILTVSYAHPHKNLFVDELLNVIIKHLSDYDYNVSDIQSVQIIGLDFFLQNLLCFYDMVGECGDKAKQQAQAADYINQLCLCTRDRLRNLLLEHGSESPLLPIFKNMEDVSFLLDMLEPEMTILEQVIVLEHPQNHT